MKPANDELIKSRTRTSVTEQNLKEAEFGASVSQLNCDFTLIIKSRVFKAFKNKKELSLIQICTLPYKLALKLEVSHFVELNFHSISFKCKHSSTCKYTSTRLSW